MTRVRPRLPSQRDRRAGKVTRRELADYSITSRALSLRPARDRRTRYTSGREAPVLIELDAVRTGSSEPTSRSRTRRPLVSKTSSRADTRHRAGWNQTAKQRRGGLGATPRRAKTLCAIGAHGGGGADRERAALRELEPVHRPGLVPQIHGRHGQSHGGVIGVRSLAMNSCPSLASPSVLRFHVAPSSNVESSVDRIVRRRRRQIPAHVTTAPGAKRSPATGTSHDGSLAST